MSVIESQLAAIRERYPDAVAEALPSGAFLISVPGVALPEGWNAASTTVFFIAPNGYPFAQPDCFWVEEHIRLANNSIPQSANPTPITETSRMGLWFSWHLSHGWNPNVDNLSSWLGSILSRLRPAR